MRKLLFGLIYTALLAGANAAAAADPDILGLRSGDMKKLIVHDAPQAVSSASFELADDAGTARMKAGMLMRMR